MLTFLSLPRHHRIACTSAVWTNIPSSIVVAPQIFSPRRNLGIKTKKFSATSGVEWVSICGIHEEDHYLRSLSRKEREKRIKAILDGGSSGSTDVSSSSSTGTRHAEGDYHDGNADNNNSLPS